MLNDISLPLGGRFEVSDPPTQAQTWANLAHCDHRWGRGTDVRTNTWQVDGFDKDDPSPEVQGMMNRWLRLNPGLTPKQAYFWEGDHLHLKTPS